MAYPREIKNDLHSMARSIADLFENNRDITNEQVTNISLQFYPNGSIGATIKKTQRIHIDSRVQLDYTT